MAAVCLCLLTLSACAGKEQPERWIDAKPKVESRLLAMDAQHQAIEAQLKAQQTRIDALEQIINTQRAQISSMSRILEQMRHPPKPKAVKVAQEPKSVAKPSTAHEAEPVVVDGEQIKNAYTAAYLSLKSLRFAEATAAFRAFIKQYPNSAYTDQAWFWLGESLYHQKQWDEALRAYHIVASDYPKSVKHAAALLKVALLYRQNGKLDEAEAILRRLLREHPDSDVAANAKNLLTSLRQPAQNPTGKGQQ